MTDRDLIYYPVHLTAGYEAALKSSGFQSNVRNIPQITTCVGFCSCEVVLVQGQLGLI